jgi:hypothetical protein
MKALRKIALGTGKVMLAVLGCVLMPILIWVALGVAINQSTSKKRLKIKRPQDWDKSATAGLIRKQV